MGDLQPQGIRRVGLRSSIQESALRGLARRRTTQVESVRDGLDDLERDVKKDK